MIVAKDQYGKVYNWTGSLNLTTININIEINPSSLSITDGSASTIVQLTNKKKDNPYGPNW